MSTVSFLIFKWTTRCFYTTVQSQSILRAAARRRLCTPCLRPLLPSAAAATVSAPASLLPCRRPSSRGFAAAAGGAGQSPAAGGAGNIVTIQDDADYDKRVRSSKQPVVLQFHATWCAPCKLLKPRLEKAVRGRAKLLLATVDVDQLPDLAAEFRVSSVPMVLALREGRVVDSFVGLREPEAVQDFVDSFCEKQGV